MDRTPHIPPELVAWLDTHIPARPPSMEWSDRMIWHEVGRRAVVEFLQTHMRFQQDNILKETP